MNVLLTRIILMTLGHVEKILSVSTHLAVSTANVKMVSDHQRML